MKIFKELFYKFSCISLYLFFKSLFRLSVKGRENIPVDRNFILIARHRSYWDVPMLAAALGSRYRIYFVARKTLINENWFIGFFVNWYAITIDRENFSHSDFRQILKSLKDGKILGIFPEGTTLGAEKIYRGVLRFAEMSGRELLPVNIFNKGPYPPNYPFSYPKMTIEIGKPFGIGDLEAQLEADLEGGSRHDKLGELMMEKVDNPH